MMRESFPFVNRGGVVFLVKDVPFFNRKSKQISDGIDQDIEGPLENENGASKTMIVERSREEKNRNKEMYVGISTFPVPFSFSFVERDVLLGMTKNMLRYP